MHRTQRAGLALLVLLLVAALASAAAPAVARQAQGGQIYVRAFEDRNGNAARDAGEPLITRGVGVNLLDAQGVIIATALLDVSPTAAQGLVGWTMLPAGTYTVEVTSAEFDPTGETRFTANLTASGMTALAQFDFPATRAAAFTTTSGAAPVTADDRRVQLIASAFSAVLVVVVMALFGTLVFSATLAPRMRAARAADTRTTGVNRAVRPSDTGTNPRVER